MAEIKIYSATKAILQTEKEKDLGIEFIQAQGGGAAGTLILKGKYVTE